MVAETPLGMLEVWRTLLIAAIPPTIAGVVMAWQTRVQSVDKNKESTLTRDERRTKQLDELDAHLDAERSALVAELRQDLRGTKADLILAEAERDWWRAQAVKFYWLWRELLGNARQVWAMCMGMARRLQREGMLRDNELPQLPDLPASVPDLESPAPRAPST